MVKGDEWQERVKKIHAVNMMCVCMKKKSKKLICLKKSLNSNNLPYKMKTESIELLVVYCIYITILKMNKNSIFFWRCSNQMQLQDVPVRRVDIIWVLITNSLGKGNLLLLLAAAANKTKKKGGDYFLYHICRVFIRLIFFCSWRIP